LRTSTHTDDHTFLPLVLAVIWN